MRYSTVLSRLQNLINREITQAELCRILNVKQSTMGNRQNRDSNFSEEEIATLNNYFNIDIYTCNPKCDNPEQSELIEIEHIHINPSCGYGTVVLDEPDITPVKLGKKMIETVLKVSNVNNLKTFTASGDSMEDTIDDGNLLLVDLGRTDFTNGGIFVITINNDWYVKRLRKRLSGELDVISDNTAKYPVETYTSKDNIEIVVKGRVIKNLSKGL